MVNACMGGVKTFFPKNHLAEASKNIFSRKNHLAEASKN